MSHASTAARVRLDKERNPDRYCRFTSCLWATGGARGIPCPKHPVAVPDPGNVCGWCCKPDCPGAGAVGGCGPHDPKPTHRTEETTMTLTTNYTDEQIAAFEMAAGEHGDAEQVAPCRAALAGDAGSRAKCERAMAAADAQDDE